MRVLTKKLWRTVRSTRGQFFAVTAVVMVGITIYISMATTSYNMTRSRDTFYREYNFADYYFHVIRAPQGVIRQIEAVPGVVKATGRIQKDVPVIKENGERATARLTSYPLPMETEVNRLLLLSGRLFEKYPESGGGEVLLDPKYAAANRLAPGDTVTVVAEGRQVPLTVTGTATSPEFIYVIQDAANWIPEPETFGIFMVPHNQAEQVLNLSGQVNQVLVKTAPGADEEKVAEAVEAILEPYGNLAAYPRNDQMSASVLQGELDQLAVESFFLPSIFLGIAALIQFVMLGRMVKTQRLQIGTMKALGYGNLQLMLHYAGYSVMVGFCGALAGSLPGVLLASSFSQVYAMYFNLPEVISGVNPQAMLYGLILSVSVGAVAGAAASRGVLGVRPAESMRPESPKRVGRFFLERWSGVWRRLGVGWKMSLRTINRNRFRTAVTLVGVIFATGMLVVAFFGNDMVGYMLDKQFYQDQRYDYFVRFTAPVREAELFTVSRLDGVVKTEPVLEVPVRLHFQGRSQEELLVGIPPDTSMRRLWSDTGRPLELPEQGLLISRSTAAKLGAGVGDEVRVETLLGFGPSRWSVMKIAGVNQEFVGGTSYTTLAQANRVLQEDRLVSGAMLKVDPGLAGQVGEELREMTGVASVLSRQKALESFNEQLEYMYYFVGIMVFFAAVLGFAIVYNASVMSFGERKRELASLRVMGFTVREVSGLLLKENLLQTLTGVALGLPFGRVLAEGYINAMMQSEAYTLYSFEVVIYPLTYLLSALGGVLFIMTAYRFAAKNVLKLDLVEVLKTRD